MLKRFTNSLFNPQELANYRNDKKYITAIYYFLLLLITMIPSFILVFTSSGFDYNSEKMVRNAFMDTEIPYILNDHQMVLATPYEEQFYEVELLPNMLYVVFTDQETLSAEINPMEKPTVIVLAKNEAFVLQSFLKSTLFRYDEYDNLKDIDFSKAAVDDYDFWKTVLPVIYDQMEKFLPTIRAVRIIVAVLDSAIWLTLFSLVLAFFLRVNVQGIYRFSKIWQLCIYSMTPYAIGFLIANLYSWFIFLIIGATVSIIYSRIMVRRLLEGR